MKNILKKSLLTIIGCFVVVFTIFLSACGDKPLVKPWGKTLGYSGMTTIDNMIYTIDGKNLKLSKILTDYFDKIDWESSINMTKTELGDGANALKLVKQKLMDNFDETELQNTKFIFSEEEDKKVTINSKKYDVEVKGEGRNLQYNIIFANEENNMDTATMNLYDSNGDDFVYVYGGSVIQNGSSFLNITFNDDVLVGATGFATKGGSISLCMMALFK